MNEPHRQVGREFIEESLLKIESIREGVACAIAGDVMRAFDITQFISENWDSFTSVNDAFAAVTRSFGPFDQQAPVELLLVCAEKGRDVQIATWNSVTAAVDVGSDLYQIGSLDEAHRRVTSDMIGQVRRTARDHASALAAGIAVVQSFGRHDDLTQQHVGGVICGLRVNGGATIWQEDTITVLYTERGIEGGIATTFREGVLAIDSSFHGEIGAVLTTRHSREDGEAVMRSWSARWAAEVFNYIRGQSHSCRTWIFLHRQRRLATIVRSVHSIDHARRLFTQWFESDQHQMEFSPDFWAELNRSTDARLAANIGVDLSVFVVNAPL